jgi:hypothetical protein
MLGGSRVVVDTNGHLCIGISVVGHLVESVEAPALTSVVAILFVVVLFHADALIIARPQSPRFQILPDLLAG